MHIVKFEDLF